MKAKKEFIIHVYVGSERELYSEFDPFGLVLNSDLKEYLSDYLEDRRFLENVILELHSSDEPDMERFKKAYDQFMEKLISRNKREKRKYVHESVRLLLTGIAFIVLGILVKGKVDEVVAVIISTIGSFSVWEASAVWIKMLPSLRKRAVLLKYLSRAQIRFVGERNAEPGTNDIASEKSTTQ